MICDAHVHWCNSTGLLGGRAARLLVTLLVLHSLKVATSAVTLTVVAPFKAGGVEVTDSAKYPLLAIVRCNGLLTVNVSPIFPVGNKSLQVQIDKSSNNPNESFVLPSQSHTVIPEGDYEILIVCQNLSSSDDMSIHVNVFAVTDSAAPEYFTNASRYLNVSASTLLGTVVITYIAEVSVVHSLLLFDIGLLSSPL